MSILEWLISGRRQPSVATKDDHFGEASGSESHDLYPVADDFAFQLRRYGLIREDQVEALSERLATMATGGKGYLSMVESIVSTGHLLPSARLKDLGLPARLKISEQYLGYVAPNDVGKSIEGLEFAIAVAMSRANHLHNLQRMTAAGITHCRFSGPHDKRRTAFEDRMDGKRITIRQARKIAIEHDAEISRSVFLEEAKS